MDLAAQNSNSPTRKWTGRLGRWLNDGFKRLSDLLFSSLALLLLWPFFLILGLAIRRGSPGPVFYRGSRLGRHGRVFKILKFRTMYETPESYQGPRVTAQDDPRVTSLGRWLRQTKLNELPQLWNVLKGEMSLVGPRPEDLQLAEGWPAEVRQEVLSVRPGITSPASVLYRDEEDQLRRDSLLETYFAEILPTKLRLDQLYVRNRSAWLDLDVLFWTLLVLLPRLGGGQPPEQALFSGPFTRWLRRPISWFGVDALITLFALALTGVIWRAAAPLNVGWGRSIVLALIFALLFSLCGMLFGVHRVSWTRADYGEIFNLLAAAGLATGLVLVLNIVFGAGQPLFPLGMLLTAAVLSFSGFVLARYRGRLLGDLAQGWLGWRGGGARAAQERVLIVGSGEAGQFSAWMLTNGRNAGVFNVVGFIDDDLYKQGLRIRGVNVIGRRDEIPYLVRKHDVGLLVFAIHNITPPERQSLLEICAATPARLVQIPDVWRVLNGHGYAGQAESTSPSGARQPVQEELVDQPSQAAGPDLAQALEELEQLALAGDLVALRQRLGELRSRLDGESVLAQDKVGTSV